MTDGAAFGLLAALILISYIFATFSVAYDIFMPEQWRYRDLSIVALAGVSTAAVICSFLAWDGHLSWNLGPSK